MAANAALTPHLFDVVMSFSKKDGTATEIKVNLRDCPVEVATSYCVHHKMKMSLVPTLAEVIRKRRDEALLSYKAKASPVHSFAPQTLNPFDLDHATFSDSSNSNSSFFSNPFDQFLQDGGSLALETMVTNPFEGFSQPAPNGSDSPSHTPRSSSSGAMQPGPPKQELAYGGAWPAGVSPSSESPVVAPHGTPRHSAFQEVSDIRGRQRVSPRQQSLTVVSDWEDPLGGTTAQGLQHSPQLRSSSAPATKTSVFTRPLQEQQLFSGTPFTAATAGSDPRTRDSDLSVSQLENGHFYLLGGHHLSPRQESCYMPKMSPNRSLSVSPSRPLRNQASVDRLYGEHHKMQARHRRLSMTVDKMKKQVISSSDFRNGVAYHSSMVQQRQLPDKGDVSFHEWLYYTGLKWAEVRDKHTKERARELAQKEDDEFKANATFAPKITTAAESVQRSAESSSSSSKTPSVFDALYKSRLYYSDKVNDLRKNLDEQVSKEMVFSPKLETGQRTAALAKKWREREDKIQRGGEVSSSSYAVSASASDARKVTSILCQPVTDDQVLTLADLANPETAFLDSTNPFDTFWAPHVSHDARQLPPQLVHETTKADESLAHLSFFDSITIKGSSPHINSSPGEHFLSDTRLFDDDIFTLEDLQNYQQLPVQPSPRGENGNRLFHRLHEHKVSVAVELAKKKYEQVFDFKPQICARSKNSQGFVSIEEDPQKFFARLSRKQTPRRQIDVGKQTSKKLDSKAESELVARMTERYPKRSEKLRVAALNSLENAPKVVFTKSRSDKLAARARRESLRSIFELLLATVDFSCERDGDGRSEEMTGGAAKGTAPRLLDTRRVITSLLQPKALVNAIDMVIRNVYPAPLSLQEFIEAIEKLIFSGKCEPISAHLSAPVRNLNEDVSAAGMSSFEHTSGRLELQARKRTENLAKKRRRANNINVVECES